MEEQGISRIARLMKYPETVSDKASEYRFFVDGHEVLARLERGGTVLLRLVLCYLGELRCEEEEVLRPLSGYAFGRVMSENAVLAHDAEAGSLLLWQRLVMSLSDGELREQLEAFFASCDWWRRRLAELTEERPSFPEMVFRP